MAIKMGRDQRLARDRKRRMLAVVICFAIAVAIGVGAWVSTLYHPAM